MTSMDDDQAKRDRALYKRLVLSMPDLRDAGTFVHRLLGRGSFVGAPELDATARKALQIALVVSYSRPFSTNRKAADVQSTLPPQFVECLSESQRALHSRLRTLRDQEFAHSDPGPADLRVSVGQFPGGAPLPATVRSVSSTKAAMSDDELIAIEDLIDELLGMCRAEQARIHHSLSPGERF